MKKITFLFALLCASVMGFAQTWDGSVVGHVSNVWLDGIGSATDRTEFDYAVNYQVEYESGTMTITIGYATENFDKIVGLSPQIFVNNAFKGNFTNLQWSSSEYAAGTELSIYFYFAYDGGANGSSQFNYTIPSGGGSEPTPAKVSECEGSRGHEGGTPHLDFVISYDGTTTTLTATPKSAGIEFDFFQINVNGTVTDLMGGAATKASVVYTTDVAANTELYIAFLYSPTDFGGNYQTTASFQANSNDPNIIYYKVGDCAAGGSDTEKPSMADATVTKVSQTHNSVIIGITGADDNVEVTQYVVKNHSDDSSFGEYTPAEDKITISGLSPNTGYDWDIYAKDAAGNVSDNCKNITFTTDALVSNYCGETVTKDDKSIALTCELVSAGNYRIIIEGSNLSGLGGTFYNPGAVDLRTKITSSSSTRIVCELDAEPTFYTPLYVNMPGEVSFTWPNDVVWGTCPAVAVTGVSLNKSELEMVVGGATQTLVATIAPANATNQNVTWTSDHPEIASVVDGVVTANAEGEAIITVTTDDGSYTDQCSVNVTVPAITPATYNGYGSDKGVYALYSITRDWNQSLVFSVKVDAAFSFNKQVHYYKGEVNEWADLVYNSQTDTYDYTADAGPFVDGEEWVVEFYFPFTGAAASIVCNYTVGSEQAVPASIPVGAVVLNKAATTLAVNETDNLTATVYPSFATAAGSIEWASDATDYATVDAGTVTAVAAGTANITAACGGVTSNTCVVTVAASLEEAKFYGCGAFVNNAGKVVSYDYAFTRATNHQVTLDVVFSRSMNGIIGENNFQIYINGVNQQMTYNDANRTATYAFGEQTESASINYYFYFVLDGDGVHQIPQTAYIVGSANEAAHAFAIGEKEDTNEAALAAVDGQSFDKVFVARSFTAGSLYTLVLPFDADAAQTAEKLPGKLTKLSNSYIKDNGDLRINFVDAEAIEAGVPYLYEPSADVTNPVFVGVTIDKELNPTEPADGYAKYYGIYASMDGAGLKAIPNAYVLGSDQYLYDVQALHEDQTMKALRGYFVLDFPDTPNGAPKPRARIIFNSHETQSTTGISEVEEENVPCRKFIENGMLYIIRDGKAYNAQGQLIK